MLIRSRGLKRKPVVGTIIEEDSDFELKENVVQGTSMHRGSEWDYFFESEEQKQNVEFAVPVRPVVNKGVTEIARRRRRSREPVSLVQIFGDLDNHFLEAFESSLEVCRMSEAKRLNYRPNFADNRANDHTEDIETLATVLNKLLAWETKLYDEIKVQGFSLPLTRFQSSFDELNYHQSVHDEILFAGT